MQPFNLIVHNTSQLLYRMGWDARNELYCSALHMSRPYMVFISSNRLSGTDKSQMSPVSTVVCIVFL